jgi:hypothetical protein
MDTASRIINEMEVSNNIQGRHNDIAFRANSRTLTEEDIRILTFANGAIVEEPLKEELAFDKNVFKPLHPHDALG